MLRDRITITLNPELVSAVDELVGRSAVRNRSHAIEHLLTAALALHDFRQAFIVAPPKWDEGQIDKTIHLTTASGITQYLLCAASQGETARSVNDDSALSELAASIRTLHSGLAGESPEVTVLPGQFGTGGALLLAKRSLAAPFAVISLGSLAHLPSSLLPAYTAHRQRGALATHLVGSDDGQTYSWIGVSILNPETLEQIETGYTDLETDLFPRLYRSQSTHAYPVPN